MRKNCRIMSRVSKIFIGARKRRKETHEKKEGKTPKTPGLERKT